MPFFRGFKACLRHFEGLLRGFWGLFKGLRAFDSFWGSELLVAIWMGYHQGYYKAL